MNQVKTWLKISTTFPGILCLDLWRVQNTWKTISVTLLKSISVIRGFLFHPTSCFPSKRLSVWQAGVSGVVALRMCLLPFNSLRSPRWFKWFSGVRPRGKWDGEHDGAEPVVLGCGKGHSRVRGTERTGVYLRQRFEPHHLKGDFSPCSSLHRVPVCCMSLPVNWLL